MSYFIPVGDVLDWDANFPSGEEHLEQVLIGFDSIEEHAGNVPLDKLHPALVNPYTKWKGWEVPCFKWENAVRVAEWFNQITLDEDGELAFDSEVFRVDRENKKIYSKYMVYITKDDEWIEDCPESEISPIYVCGQQYWVLGDGLCFQQWDFEEIQEYLPEFTFEEYETMRKKG